MASRQRDIITLIEQLQKGLDSAVSGLSKKTEARRSSDTIPGTSGDVRNENDGKMTPVARAITTKRLYDATEQHQSDLKRPRRMSINNSELRFRCSYCSARFPSLTMVRDHTRACHRDENEWRREKKSNRNSTKLNSTTVVGNSTTGSKLNQLERKSTFLFRCKACKFASVSYSHMIEHCQYHVVTSENPEAFVSRNSTRKCVISNEEYDVDFDTYNECKCGSDYAYKLINCDYNLLKQDKWPGIVDNLTKPEIDMINCNSIYYFTRIVRLTSQKMASSAPFMVFQCEKCLKHIDPHSVLAHVVENSCNKELPEYPCYECKRPFLNENTMYLHYKMHQAAVSSNMNFRTVFFNHKDDDFFNALLLKAAGVIMQNASSRKKSAQAKLSDDAKAQIQVKTSPQAKDVQKVTEVTSQNVPNWSKLAQSRSDITKTQILFLNNSTPVKDVQKTTELTPVSSGSQLQRSLTSGAAKSAKEPIQLKIVLERIDARSLIIPGTTTGTQNKTVSEITSNIAKDTDKPTTVYKCQCELSFHKLECLFRHLGKCPSDKTARISCVCGLVFDEQQYQLHYGIHSQGLTKLNVKRIIMFDEKIIGLNNKINEKEKRELDYNQLCKKAISELIDTIKNIASSLPDIREIKTEVREEIIAEPETRSVGSGDGLITVAFKSQGTMTEREIQAKQAEKKSVATDTDDLNISVPGVQTVHEVNNKLCNRKQAFDAKSVGSGVDNSNKSVMTSQGTISRTAALTILEVKKELGNTKQATETKSVDSVSDDLNISVMKSQGKFAVVSEIQTAYEANIDKNNIKEDVKTMLVGSEAGDINISLLKSQTIDMMTNTEAQPKVTKISSSSFELDLSCAREEDGRLVVDVNNKFKKPNQFNCGADKIDKYYMSILKTIIEAKTKESVTDKTKAHHSTESTRNISEKNINISETKLEDHNETVTKVDQTQKSLDMNQGKNAFETQAEKNKEYDKNIETIESDKNKDVVETKGSTSRIYTEDELLNGPDNPEMSVYFDAEESLLTDDEGPILLYEDDDIIEDQRCEKYFIKSI
ncbi:uncharacterized protein LOC134677389 [Cydia fagiglandana]|uniref:uncharacterized protein LOC134677389 n=1 Tax=Cydia fagiglandana TaxID=1458189 RepID=UPI002FEE1690